MYTTDKRLCRQRLNLEHFVTSHASKFDLMKYSPWTYGTPMKTAVKIEPSRQLSPFLGVFPSEDKVRKSQWIVATYPGVVMWHQLHEEFDSIYHCPTAVRVDVLDYEVDRNTAKKMSIKVNNDGR